uniref:NADH-ubiquinone oxidoreductase chain 5 n=1 Tax=Exothotettix guangxiensis TaxID=3068914 RepID=A0AA51YDZ8_9ORTH|nr:NADH dehydrogenase subunit 5 [Exothotettix guangxiensis]WMV02051.1 NADH dehydrogenase subunit 5 [Exothotettix guangxiensis]
MLNNFYISSFFFLFGGFFFFVTSLFFLNQDMSFLIEWEICSFNSSMIIMAVILDWMSLIFMSFVLIISSVVLYYSNDYMYGDVNFNRFIILVSLFVLSMMFLIISPNLISILLGWDGLGLVSYCLVIYYQNVKSVNAGLLTALSNRVGDVLILLSISWMLNFGSWNYIYYYDYFFNSYNYSIICLMVMVAGMTKSAQIPFSAWLPAAMAAPTPVSALVHSSTLVTAGVYLLIRFSPMLFSSKMNSILLLIGCLTMLMSGIVANYEFDLKKIIALSTLSQLGLMVGILGFGYPLMSFFHLLTHALFKSLLFLCAGCYIHSLFDNQDIRYMGSLTLFMPYTSACLNIANLSLCGFPFLSGFYSKDLILELSSFGLINLIIYFLFFFSTGLTTMYSFRLLYYSLIKPFSFSTLFNFNVGHDMNVGMFFLLLFTVLGGSLLSWLIFPVPICIYLPFNLKMLTMVLILLGLYFGYLLSLLHFNMKNLCNSFFINDFIGLMWFMPIISTKLISYNILLMGGLYSSFMDYGWLEYYGAQGIYNFFMYFIKHYLNLFDYNFKTYLMMFSLFFMLLFFMIIL